MVKKRRQINVFSASFLDVLCCALGGVILLVVAMGQQNQEQVEELESANQKTMKQLVKTLKRIEIAEIENQRIKQENQQVEEKYQQVKQANQRIKQENQQVGEENQQVKQENQQMKKELKGGFEVPLPLAVRLDWVGQGDIDLSVVGPNGTRVFYNHKVEPWGQLMRDETKGQENQTEVFYSMEPVAGTYKIYISYYGGGNKSSYDVNGVVSLYPYERTLKKQKEFKSQVNTRAKGQWKHVATYELRKNSSGKFQLSFSSFSTR